MRVKQNANWRIKRVRTFLHFDRAARRNRLIDGYHCSDVQKPLRTRCPRLRVVLNAEREVIHLGRELIERG